MVHSAMPVLVTKSHPARQGVEALIAQVYAREYGATRALNVPCTVIDDGAETAAYPRGAERFFVLLQRVLPQLVDNAIVKQMKSMKS